MIFLGGNYMDNKNIVKIFDNKNIRTIWNAEEERYYFSIIDVISVLTNSVNSKNYWYTLKNRLKKEGNETLTNCKELKMKAEDGKQRNTDVMDTEQLLRLIQSIPSPKAEPFKIWLASVGSERIDETFDPELAIARAINVYRQKGYDQKWIENRIKTITNRNELTDAWNEHGVENNSEFAILTNEIYKTWSDMTAREYKNHKNLTKESLRDNMTNTELALNNLAEVATKDLIDKHNPYGLEQNKKIAREGGSVAKTARKDLEKRLGNSVISKNNNKSETKFIENE